MKNKNTVFKDGPYSKGWNPQMGPWFWNCFLRGSIENQIGQLQISQNRKQTLVSIFGDLPWIYHGFTRDLGCWLLELPTAEPGRSGTASLACLRCVAASWSLVYGVARVAPIKTMNQTRAWISYNICNPSAALPGNGNGISLFVYIDCVPIRRLCFTNVHCFFLKGNADFCRKTFFSFSNQHI